MERSILDELPVPMPPYQSRAVLAMAEAPESAADPMSRDPQRNLALHRPESLNRPTPETVPAPAPEQIVRRLSEAEQNAIERVFSAPPIPDAFPEITKEDLANKDVAGKKIKETTQRSALTLDERREEFEKAREKRLGKAHELEVTVPAETGRPAVDGEGKPEVKAEPDFEIEFPQPSKEEDQEEKRKQFIEATKREWETKREAGEARRQEHIKKRDAINAASGETPPPKPATKPVGRGPRMNLLNGDMGSSGGNSEDRPVQIPPMPGSPGGPISESLRGAARHASGRAETPEAESSAEENTTPEDDGVDIEALAELYTLSEKQTRERIEYWRKTRSGDDIDSWGRYMNEIMNMLEGKFQQVKAQEAAKKANKRVNVKPRTPEGEAIAAARAAAEKAATSRERLVAELQEKVARLEAELSARNQGGAGGGQPPGGGGGEEPPTTGAEGESQSSNPAESAVIQEAQAILDKMEIEQLGDTRPVSFWTRVGAFREQSMHNTAAWWFGLGERIAKEKLANQEKKVRQLERDAEGYAKSSKTGQFFSPFRYGIPLLWARKRRDDLEASQNYFMNLKGRHEDARNEVLNAIGHQLDVKLQSHERRARECTRSIDKLIIRLEELNTEIIGLTQTYSNERDVVQKVRLEDQLKSLQNEYVEKGEEIDVLNVILGKENEEAVQAGYLKSRYLRRAHPKAIPPSEQASREDVLPTRQKREERYSTKRAA